MIVILIIFIAITIMYIFALLWFHWGLSRLQNLPLSVTTPTITIIVPARNEKDNILRCITALSAQNYPTEKFQVFIVNDRSEDNTAEIAGEFCTDKSNFHLLNVESVPKDTSPKKYALNIGIDASDSELIFTTDADCEPEPDWILNLSKLYSDPKVGMVAGYSPIRVNRAGLFPMILGLDALSLAAVAAGGAGAGYPVTCTGRSLSYRRSVFSAIGGFDGLWNYMSGDDDLLLHKMKTAGWRILYSFHKNSLVPSRTSLKPSDLSNQRRRHASKGMHYYKLPGMSGLKIALPLIYLFNLLIVTSLVGLTTSIPTAFVVLGIKSAAEFLFLNRFAGYTDEKHLLKTFPIAAILHPFYITVFGLWGAFGKFVWKGQTSSEIEKTA